MAFSQKLNLLFIHIPKNAGTSIIEAMKAIDPGVSHGHEPWKHYQQLLGADSSIVSFAVVRNPWDRAFSCYRYALQQESYWHGAGKRWGMHPDFDLLRGKSFAETVEILYEKRAA